MLKRLHKIAYRLYKAASDIWDESTTRFKVFRALMDPFMAGNPVCTAGRGLFGGAGIALAVTGYPTAAAIFLVPLVGLILIERLDWHKEP